MGTDVAEALETLPYPSVIKVHRLMCTELMKLVDRISRIFPGIEAVRPRCSTGIQALCSLNRAIERAKSLLQYCSESSKLYLAITGNAIVLRFEKTRNLLEQSLSEIQNMVPVTLAVEISQIVEDLRSATFILDSSEEEAGKVVRALLQKDTSASDSVENSELEALQLAALRLQITSSKALLVEKRSIKKLLEKVGDGDPTKKKILRYLAILLKKYEKKLIMREQTGNACAQHEGSFLSADLSKSSLYDQSVEVESHVGFGQDEAQTDMLSRPILPEEFKCPISFRLMYDPVVIASGQTFERISIQKWFDEGHDICPKTKKKLGNLSLTPNTAMKDLISKWCMEHGIIVPDLCMQPASVHSWDTSSNSITSFGSSMNDLHLRIDLSNVSLGSLDTSYCSDSSRVEMKDGLSLMSLQTNDDSHSWQSYVNTYETHPEYLSKLAVLPWESQHKTVEDVKNHLNYNDQACYSMTSENFVEPLLKFLKDAHDRHDVKAMKDGSQLFLAFVSKSRSGIQYLYEDAFNLLACFLDSEVTEEALAIMVLLSGNKYCGSKIAASGALTSVQKILDTQTREFLEPAIKILYHLSANSDTRSHFVILECIPKLVPFLDDSTLARYCIIILKNLCTIEEARVSIAETNGCIASIAALLETGSHEDQGHAVAILVSLCSQRDHYCQLVMNEGVIPALCTMSINGNDIGKAGAMELLRLLRDIEYNDVDDSRDSSKERRVQECSGFDVDDSRDSSNHSTEKKSSSKASGLFGLRRSMFSKSSSLIPKKKK